MIKLYEEFHSINESNIDTWLDYEKDTSGQADDWLNDKITSSNEVKSIVKKVVNDWNNNVDLMTDKLKTSQPHVEKLVKEFFAKHKWINGNIISAMLAQEGE